MSRRKSGAFMETVRTVIYAVLIAVAVRTFAYEPFNIPSGSMKPTLLVGDYLFVSKASYGYSKHSLPLSLPLFRGRIWFTQPERGDVAVFKLPSDGRTDYIKRIIGLAGDRIEVRAGILRINDQPVRRERIEDYLDDGRPMTQYVETLPNGVSHRIVERSDSELLDDTGIYTVPPGHYFAMGDNRDNSSDSRVLASVGFVPEENLVGRAEFLFLSVGDGGRIWEFWNWRLGRLFTAVR